MDRKKLPKGVCADRLVEKVVKDIPTTNVTLSNLRVSTADVKLMIFSLLFQEKN